MAQCIINQYDMRILMGGGGGIKIKIWRNTKKQEMFADLIKNN